MGSNHSLSMELGQVHNRMKQRYNLQQQAAEDVQKAYKMEMYLRNFKVAGNEYWKKEKIQPGYKTSIETQAMEEIATQVRKNLKLGSSGLNALFRWKHKDAQDVAKSVGADDIFEAELNEMLQVASKMALQDDSQKIDSGAQILGRVAGNVSEGILKELEKQFPAKVASHDLPDDLTGGTHARSIKADVGGYSRAFRISASIKPQWLDFINTFTGVKMSVKNYSSGGSSYQITLGDTAIQKSIPAILSNLGYSDKKAVHIYYHILGEQPFDTKTAGHVIHLRFAYELTGGGLYSEKKRLDSADFFVYNDPNSNNIWVRSTKQMIANAMDYTDFNIGNPLHSKIVVLKRQFN